MDTTQAEIKRKGRIVKVQSTVLDGRTIVSTGKWLRVASVKDEDYLEGDVVDAPDRFVAHLKREKLGADLFTFIQKLPEVTPRHGSQHEWDNFAAISTESYDKWWKEKVSTNLRKDVRRAQNRGVIVKPVPFNDDFVRAIIDIYNETPIRQGRPFWHYQKDFDTVRADTATYLERSEFLGAYLQDELIGFLKIVYVDRLGCLMQIISKMAHQDKRPTNAMIAKAVEVCATKKCIYLTYGKYKYGNIKSSLTDFKERNGFEEVLVPRYDIPVTVRGRIALALNLHRGAKSLIPPKVLAFITRVRSGFFKRFAARETSKLNPGEIGPADASGVAGKS